MSKIKNAIEELKELGWNIDNESLKRLVKLRKELKEKEKQKRQSNETSEEKQLRTN